jgi:FixJ family two-component response regulator
MSRIQEIFHDWMVHKNPIRELRQTPVGIKVIAITRSRETQAVVEEIAKKRGWEVSCSDSLEDALKRKDTATAVILVDQEIFGEDWKDAVAGLMRPPHRCCVILMSPDPTDRFCYDFIHHGGYSVLKTPLEELEATEAVRRAGAFWRACISRAACRSANA